MRGICIVILLFVGCSSPETSMNRVEKKYYSNGQVAWEAPLNSDGLFEGVGREYFESGKLKSETDLVNGVANGESIDYYETGETMTREVFVKGKRNGEVVHYYRSGQMKEKKFYSRDLLEGSCKKFYEDGKIKVHFEYENGLLNGVQMVYHENGKLATIGEMVNEKKESFWFYFDQFGDTLEAYEYVRDSVISKKVFKDSFKTKNIEAE